MEDKDAKGLTSIETKLVSLLHREANKINEIKQNIPIEEIYMSFEIIDILMNNLERLGNDDLRKKIVSWRG